MKWITQNEWKTEQTEHKQVQLHKSKYAGDVPVLFSFFLRSSFTLRDWNDASIALKISLFYFQ